jgi:hypothetical protein
MIFHSKAAKATKRDWALTAVPRVRGSRLFAWDSLCLVAAGYAAF